MDTLHAGAAQGRGWRGLLRDKLGPDFALGYMLLLPLAIVLFGLLAYPIVYALYITLQDKTVGMPGHFIGLDNYRRLLFEDKVFWRVVQNAFIFTIGSVSLKAIFGMILALVLNRPIKFRGFFRGLLLLPWVAPTVVTALA
jgi:multiple sugar transport system permease protein